MTLIETEKDLSPTTQSEPKLLILKPHGAQGPGIALEIQDEDAYRKLDEAMGQLSETKRRTVSGIRNAASTAKIPIVDF